MHGHLEVLVQAGSGEQDEADAYPNRRVNRPVDQRQEDQEEILRAKKGKELHGCFQPCAHGLECYDEREAKIGEWVHESSLDEKRTAFRNLWGLDDFDAERFGGEWGIESP